MSKGELRLIMPEKPYFESYREAREEYLARGIEGYSFSEGNWEALSEKFERFRTGNGLRPDRVPSDYYWLVDGETFVGEISIRHRLNPALERRGGHIGYGIRASRWNQGFGTKMLALVLPKVKKLGVQRALITCDDDNLGSARVIEKNGGRLENVIQNGSALTRRYWIDL